MKATGHSDSSSRVDSVRITDRRAAQARVLDAARHRGHAITLAHELYELISIADIEPETLGWEVVRLHLQLAADLLAARLEPEAAA